MVSEQDLCPSIHCLQMSKGKFYSIPKTLYYATSRNHGSHEGNQIPMIHDFPQFDGQVNIEDFLYWLVEVERYFEYENITVKKQVKFVAGKLKRSAWAWWELLQRMRTRLRKDPIQNWEMMKKYLKRQFLSHDY